jgi:hypothetical protein
MIFQTNTPRFKKTRGVLFDFVGDSFTPQVGINLSRAEFYTPNPVDTTMKYFSAAYVAAYACGLNLYPYTRFIPRVADHCGDIRPFRTLTG